eukprot:6958975-Pyramimonas_sp.AAC.1
MCQRCRRDAETPKHRIWQCPCNADSELGQVQASEHLRHEAVAEFDACQTFGARGSYLLIGSPYFSLPPPPEQ